MTGKVPTHSSVLMVSYVKEVTLKPIKYSVFGLVHIFYVPNVTPQARQYMRLPLTVPINYGIIEMG